MSQPTAVAILTTTDTTARARLLGAALIEEGLASRVTVMNGARTLSAFEGGVTEDNEVFVLILARSERLPVLLDRLHALEPEAGAHMVVVDAIAMGAALLEGS